MLETIYDSLFDIDSENLRITENFLDDLSGNSFLNDEEISPVTFFAPTDDAWVAFFNSLGLLDGADEDGANELLEELLVVGFRLTFSLGETSDADPTTQRFGDQLLGGLVVPGEVALEDLVDGATLTTSLGGAITVDAGMLVDPAPSFPDPTLPTSAPTQASNGLVYVVDQVMLPGEVRVLDAEDAGERVKVTAAEALALVVGSAEGDDVRLTGGVDFVFASDGDDTVRGGASDDGIYGGAGDDELRGGRGNDELVGGAGIDLLKGGRGADFIVDNLFFENIEVATESDTLEGGRGNDTLFAILSSSMDGGRGDDLILKFGPSGGEYSGGRGADAITGLGANSFYKGGRGSDTLLSSLADDTLKGGRGADTFSVEISGVEVFVDAESGRRDATILDFDASKDTLQFVAQALESDALDAAEALNDPNALELSDLVDANLINVTLSNQDGDLLVTLSETSALLIQGLDGDLSFDAFDALVDVQRDTDLSDLLFDSLR